MPGQPQAILFDLDGTLWDRAAAVRDVLASQYQYFSEALQQVPWHLYVERITTLESNGSADKLSVYVTCGQEWGLSDSVVERLHTDFWARYESSFQTFPEVLPTLTELRRLGVKLGIITNGTVRIQAAKIERLQLPELMDVVVISEQEGIRKPSREIFITALARLGVTAECAWFVGDNPDADVGGAYSAGLRAVWRRCSEWQAPTVPCDTISSLDQLLPMVRS